MEGMESAVGQDVETAGNMVRNFLDGSGRLSAWPAKRKLQLAALEVLASKFEEDLVYTQREVNGLLNLHHTFEDPARLRRELCDLRWLGRTADGRKYWKLARPTPPAAP